jgi:hypothetical protein
MVGSQHHRDVITWMESHMKEVAKMLSCGPASVVEVLKEKLATYDRLHDLHNQRELDLKQIQELQTNVARLILRRACSINRCRMRRRRRSGRGEQ